MRILTATLFASVVWLFVGCGAESSIADAPCAISAVGSDGAFTVFPYVKDGQIVRKSFTAHLSGIGKVDAKTAEMFRSFIAERIESTYVSAGVSSSLELEIVCIDESTGLADSLNRLLRLEISRNEGSDPVKRSQ